MGSPLTIVMATYKEFESTYFTIQGIRANHPEVDAEIIVLDNAPELCVRTRAVTQAAGGRYYHRPDLHGTSRSRDMAIRLANTPWVMCCDSHVLFENSALSALEEYVRNAEPSVMVSGPLVSDNGVVGGTHWNRAYPEALWGTWAVDERGRERDAPAFEIDMNGLGVFCVNRNFWPGFNPLNRGFGGEEGVINETYRRMGGKTVCLPALRWRHRFRDVGGWSQNPVPYPLSGEDHVWNLLVGHRENGIDNILPLLMKDFSGHTSGSRFQELDAKARTVCPLGTRPPRPRRLNILGVWYTDCTAPHPLLSRSLEAIGIAKHMHTAAGGQVSVGLSTWQQLEPLGFRNLPGTQFVYSGEKKRSHHTIIKQIQEVVGKMSQDDSLDILCFLEHDVLYPPDYFNRVEAMFRSYLDSPVVSNLDYIGLNANGWQPVKERHEPMHQLSMRFDFALANLQRAEQDCLRQGWAYLEPQGDRSKWARIPSDTSPLSVMPSVHVNHTSGRFTTHGDVCYGDATTRQHKHWGEAANYWPGPMGAKSGCGSCSSPEIPQYQTNDEWIEAARTKASDFHEHVETLRQLATKCESAAELVKWGKPSLIALASGCPGPIYSLAPEQGAPLAQWGRIRSLNPDRFTGLHGEEAKAKLRELNVDLLFCDTDHRAEVVYRQLLENAPRVKKYLVVHCTEIFGVTGDDGGPGVLHGIRRFLRENKEWVAIRHDRNNNGLMVLSKCKEDHTTPPGKLRKAMNFTKALMSHAANGRKIVPDEVFEQRVSLCLLCPERAGEACGLCGCPIEAKCSWASEECPNKPPLWTKVT